MRIPQNEPLARTEFFEKLPFRVFLLKNPALDRILLRNGLEALEFKLSKRQLLTSSLTMKSNSEWKPEAQQAPIPRTSTTSVPNTGAI